MSQEDIKGLQIQIETIENSMNTSTLASFIQKEEFKEIFDSLIGPICERFNHRAEEATRTVSDAQKDELKKLGSIIEEMDNIRLIENIKERTSELYYQTTEKVAGYIREMARKTREQLRLLKLDPLNLEYDGLFSGIQVLENAQ